MRGYGYLWWIPEDLGEDSACASGRGGQLICVLPQYGVIFVTTARLISGGLSHEALEMPKLVEKFVVPAVVSK